MRLRFSSLAPLSLCLFAAVSSVSAQDFPTTTTTSTTGSSATSTPSAGSTNASGASPSTVSGSTLTNFSMPGFVSWTDSSVTPVASLLCIHGLGLNAEAFTDFGTRMSHLGFKVYAIDVRGFGAWIKLKDGDKLDFDGALGDIKATLSAIRSSNPGLPMFLLGESMGGAVVLKACSQYPELIDGLISSAPGGSRYKEARQDVQIGVRMLTRPRKQFDIGKSIIDQATRNPDLRKLWSTDPRNRQDLSAVQLLKFQVFMNGNDDAVKKITKTPVLFLQGTLDHLVRPKDTWNIFESLKTERRVFVALPSEHLVLEYGRVKTEQYDNKVARLVGSWIQNTLINAEPGMKNPGD